MKQFYGQVPIKYLPNDTRPVLDKEKGVSGLYAPLHQTKFKSVDGWATLYREKR